MEYIHERGIIHRDIKPSNLLVDVDEATGEPKLSIGDFGLSCIEKKTIKLLNVKANATKEDEASKARFIETFNKNRGRRRRHRAGNVHEEYEEVTRELFREAGYDPIEMVERRSLRIVGTSPYRAPEIVSSDWSIVKSCV